MIGDKLWFYRSRGRLPMAVILRRTLDQFTMDAYRAASGWSPCGTDRTTFARRVIGGPMESGVSWASKRRRLPRPWGLLRRLE